MNMESHGGIILTGKTEELREKTYPSATLSTRNLAWIDAGVNLGLCGEKPATNGLSYGTDTALPVDKRRLASCPVV
jgi:hypothetical protein